MKRLLAMILTLMMLLTLCACGGAPSSNPADNDSQSEQQTPKTEEPTSTPEPEAEPKPEPEPEKPQAKKLNVGDKVTSSDWKITLTNAYTSSVLQSDQSSTYWEASDGYSFCILEFDIECLNSSKKPVDGDAIANPIAITSTDNTYESWEYQYIASQIWCSFHNTYLEANLPIHAYVYTYIPSKVMNDTVTVNIDLAGTSYVLRMN